MPHLSTRWVAAIRSSGCQLPSAVDLQSELLVGHCLDLCDAVRPSRVALRSPHRRWDRSVRVDLDDSTLLIEQLAPRVATHEDVECSASCDLRTPWCGLLSDLLSRLATLVAPARFFVRSV